MARRSTQAKDTPDASRSPRSTRPRADFRVVATPSGQRLFGAGPAELLTRIEQTGSIRLAAGDMGLSYTKALSMLKRAESAYGRPLTKRSIGGAGGGGTVLTPDAHDLLARYEAWQQAARQAAEELYGACFAGLPNVARLGCVVMASGRGHRFGSQKLVAPLAGEPLLQRTLSRIPRDTYDVVVVTRAPEVRELCQRLGEHVEFHDGPLQSDTVRVGLDVMGDRAGCLFVPGDQPLVLPESLEAMARDLSRHPLDVVRLSWEGRAKSPVLFPRRLFQALCHLEGDVGGSELLRRWPELAEGARLVEAASGIELSDVDTPADLDRVERLGHERGDW